MPADEDEDCMLPDDEGVLGPPEANFGVARRFPF
jgi:hypothetical protein